MLQIRDDMDLEKLCEGRSWGLHLCSLNDIQGVRDGFSKLTVFLLAPDEDEPSPAAPATDNRI